MPTTPAKRRRIARRAALAMHAKHGAGVTAPARAAFDQRFYDAAEASLPETATRAEIERTASFLRRRYFSELNEKSVAARRKEKK